MVFYEEMIILEIAYLLYYGKDFSNNHLKIRVSQDLIKMIQDNFYISKKTHEFILL